MRWVGTFTWVTAWENAWAAGLFGCAAAHGREDGARRPVLQSINGHPVDLVCAGEFGQQCGGQPVADELDVDAEVGAAVAHVRLEACGAAGSKSPLPGCGGGWLDDERPIRQVRELEGAPPGRYGQHQLVGEQVGALGLLQRGSGCPAYSSAITRSNSPATIAGSATSGSSSVDLDAQQRVPLGQPTSGPVAPAPSLPSGTRPTRRVPEISSADLASAALGSLHLLEQHLGVLDQQLALRGQPHAAAGWFEQATPGLALQRGELLGDGRGAVGHRLGDGGDRAAALELSATGGGDGDRARDPRSFRFSSRSAPILSRWT